MQGDALSLEDKPAKAPARKASPARTRKHGDGHEAKEREMGDALRSVYDRTVQEEVPDEFLDLLSKLD
ncbi:hypothetical protein CKY28_04820 [Sphingomonas lenta]|uniref:Anti-sigma factor NepR domain-containing protein n=1 Tax=Sphingomonas lenta TaxID=1141887 RepID=A0A2A2SHK7_9SPHN|nr:hypothetical protein CKY28_04820 [Sphingomonas lenta]